MRYHRWGIPIFSKEVTWPAISASPSNTLKAATRSGRRLGARGILSLLSLALGQAADLLATAAATSSGATETNPLLRTPAAWAAGKVTVVTAVGIVLWLTPKATRFQRAVLWCGLACSAVAVWNWTQR